MIEVVQPSLIGVSLSHLCCDVQADLLDSLTTRVVVPLVLTDQAGKAAKQLHPQFKIKGIAVTM